MHFTSTFKKLVNFKTFTSFPFSLNHQTHLISPLLQYNNKLESHKSQNIVTYDVILLVSCNNFALHATYKIMRVQRSVIPFHLGPQNMK